MNIHNIALLKNKKLLIISITGMIMNMGYSLLIPVFPLFTESLGFSVLIIGLLISTYALGKFIIQIPAGFIIDLIGAKKALCYSLFVYSISFIFYTLFSNLIIFIILRIIEGIAAGIAVISMYSLLNNSIDDSERGEGLGTFSAITSSGIALGPAISSFILIIGNSNYKLVFYIAALISLIALVLIYIYIKETNIDNIEEIHLISNFKYNINEILNNNMLISILLLGSIAFLGDFIYGSLSTILPLYGKNILNLSTSHISMLFSLNFITFAITGPFIGKLIDKNGIKRYIELSLFIIVIVFFLLSFIRSDIIFTLIIFIEFLAAPLLYISLQTLTGKIGYKNNMTGRLFGIIGTFQSLGLIIGPLLSASVYNLSPEYFFVFLSITSLMIFIIFLLNKRKII